MDDILKELKRIREEVENRFLQRLEQLEAHERRLRDLLPAASDDPGAESARRATDAVAGLIGALRDMAAVDNARSAELARQLTVLPLERMDIMLDEFERRLESLETRLQRLERAAGDTAAS